MLPFKMSMLVQVLMEFMLDGKVERDEVDCEDWSKAKHFIQRKYKLQDEPRVILEKCECEEPNEEPIKICVNCNGYVE